MSNKYFGLVQNALQRQNLKWGSKVSIKMLLSTATRTSKFNRSGIRIGSNKPLIDGQYEVTPMRRVSPTIKWPDYAISGSPRQAPSRIVTYSDEELVKIRKSAKLARQMLDYANSLVRPGITTEEIDILTHNEIVRNGAYPSPINFNGFPKAICTSVNEVVCHGIPNKRPLEKGDVVSIDVSLFLNGYHGDNCGTVIVEDGDDNLKKLVEITQLALDRAISICKPGRPLNEIGRIIEDTAHENNFEVVHEFCGHGTGPILHMSPLIRHFKNYESTEMIEGMVFTIEPILVEGSRQIGVWSDGWSAYTLDGGRGAQFEHEVLVTANGAEVLTLP